MGVVADLPAEPAQVGERTLHNPTLGFQGMRSGPDPASVRSARPLASRIPDPALIRQSRQLIQGGLRPSAPRNQAGLVVQPDNSFAHSPM